MSPFSILFGKLTSFFIKTFTNRGASTWPGHLVLEFYPKFIKDILNKNKKLKLILVAGTNGKTTTTKSLHYILEENNISSIRNEAGANLLNGLASLLIKYSNLSGKIDEDALLFEVDENSLPLILKETNPEAIILLNLFRDQLDRYGEINTTAEKWANALKKTSGKTIIIANSDDPQIVKIAKSSSGKKYFYSIEDNLKNEKELSHAVDSITCPECRSNLDYLKIAYSHIGNYKCPKCGFQNPKSEKVGIITNLKGAFNIYNLAASVLTSEKVFNINKEKSTSILKKFKPAFGRQEKIYYHDKEVIILLSKNPTGFNESLKIVTENKYSNILLILNDRIPDGKDISWIWDVDFEALEDKDLDISVAGDRTYDMANRLVYAGIKKVASYENLEDAIKGSLSKINKSEKLIILPTYSAMLETRKILTGKSIL